MIECKKNLYALLCVMLLTSLSCWAMEGQPEQAVLQYLPIAQNFYARNVKNYALPAVFAGSAVMLDTLNPSTTPGVVLQNVGITGALLGSAVLTSYGQVKKSANNPGSRGSLFWYASPAIGMVSAVCAIKLYQAFSDGSSIDLTAVLNGVKKGIIWATPFVITGSFAAAFDDGLVRNGWGERHQNDGELWVRTPPQERGRRRLNNSLYDSNNCIK